MNADPEDAEVAKYARLQPLVVALGKVLGYNGIVRDLAKAPVMTWFYSAGDKSITSNMIKSLIESVFTEAVNGNKEAIDHITKITEKNFKEIKPGSLEHKKLISHYKELGEVYTSTMTETFKDVTAYKKEMTDLFNSLVEQSQVNGKDYWGGVVRSASKVYNSEEDEPGIVSTTNGGKVAPAEGTTNVYKMKEVISDLSPKEKSDLGITDDEKDITLTTILDSKPNATSVGPLTEQSKDAAELFAALDEIHEANPNGDGIVTVHDAMYGDVNELLIGRDAYHKSVLKIAEQGDNIEGFLKAYDYTIAAMEADLESAMSDKERKALVGRINTLKKIAANMRVKNDPRIEAKKELLAGAELEMFGMQKADRSVSGDVVSRVEIRDAKPEEVKEPTKLAAEELTPFDVEFDELTSEIQKLKDNKPANVGRILELALSKSGIKVAADLNKAKFMTLSAFKASVPESLRGTDVSEILNSTDTSQRAWEVGGYVILNDSNRSLFADPKQLASVLLHEIEHTVTKGYIEAEMTKNTKAPEINYLSKLYKTVSTKPTRNLRAARLQGLDEQTFIEEIVAVYKEDPAAFENVARELGIPGSRTEGVIKRILKAVSKLIDGIIKNNGDVKVNIPNTVAALELLSTSGSNFVEDTSNRVSGVDISDLEIKGCK